MSDREHDEKPVQRHGFRVDTRRHRSHAKQQAKVRHVLAVASGMFPLGALFVWLMAMLRFEAPERAGLYRLAVGFLAAGMVSLLFYSIALAVRNRRHEITRRSREERQRAQAEALRLERERLAKRHAGETGGEGTPAP